MKFYLNEEQMANYEKAMKNLKCSCCDAGIPLLKKIKIKDFDGNFWEVKETFLETVKKSLKGN